MSRARWSPALPDNAAAVIIVILAAQAVVRGVDYLFGDRADVTTALSLAEKAMPLQMWGCLFTAGGVLVLSGVARRAPRLIIAGSGWLIAAYGALAWALFLKMIERATPWHVFIESISEPHATAGWVVHTIHAFPLDGWRSPMTCVTAAVIWGCIGWGTLIKQQAWEVSRGAADRRAT